MKNGFKSKKNICKNRFQPQVKNNICLDKRKKPFAAAFWRRFRKRNSDKESSHVVGKTLHAGGRQQ